MANVIFDRTPRQKAFEDVLAERVGQAAQLGVGAFQQAQQTARQRALQERQLSMQQAAIDRDEQRYADQQRRLDEARQFQMAKAGIVPTGEFQEDLEGLAKITRQKATQKADPFKNITAMRKEVSGLPATRDMIKIDAALGKIEKAGKAKSAAGDMSMIFSFMKIMDPGSLDRDWETLKLLFSLP